VDHHRQNTQTLKPNDMSCAIDGCQWVICRAYHCENFLKERFRKSWGCNDWSGIELAFFLFFDVDVSFPVVLRYGCPRGSMCAAANLRPVELLSSVRRAFDLAISTSFPQSLGSSPN